MEGCVAYFARGEFREKYMKNLQILKCCGLNPMGTTDAESAYSCQHPYETSNIYSCLVL